MALILDARVKQKIATEAEWMADDTVLLEGEQAFVLSGDGYVRNFKIGDGTKTFVELPYSLDYTAFAAIAPQPLAPADPAPTTSGLYIPTEDGNYTNIGLTVDRSTGGADEGKYIQFINDGGTWIKVGTPMPQPENKIQDWTAGTYNQGDQRIWNGQIWSVVVPSTTEEPGTGTDWVADVDAVSRQEFQEVEPVKNMIVFSKNLIDNSKLVFGRWNEDGSTIFTVNELRTGLISLDQSKTHIAFSGGGAISGAAARFVFFNNGAFVSFSDNSSAAIPSGATQVGVTIAYSTTMGGDPTNTQFKETAMLNYGETALPWEPFSAKIGAEHITGLTAGNIDGIDAYIANEVNAAIDPKLQPINEALDFLLSGYDKYTEFDGVDGEVVLNEVYELNQTGDFIEWVSKPNPNSTASHLYGLFGERAVTTRNNIGYWMLASLEVTEISIRENEAGSPYIRFDGLGDLKSDFHKFKLIVNGSNWELYVDDVLKGTKPKTNSILINNIGYAYSSFQKFYLKSLHIHTATRDLVTDSAELLPGATDGVKGVYENLNPADLELSPFYVSYTPTGIDAASNPLQGKFTVYCKREGYANSYSGIEIWHEVDMSEIVWKDYWRIGFAEEYTFDGGQMVKTHDKVLATGESESVWKRQNTPNPKADFTGGWHGDEVMRANGFKFLMDGKEVSLSESFDLIPASTVEYSVMSDMTEVADLIEGVTTPIAGHPTDCSHFKRTTFKIGGYKTYNKMVWARPVPVMLWDFGICCFGKVQGIQGFNDSVESSTFNAKDNSYHLTKNGGIRVDYQNPTTGFNGYVESIMIKPLNKENLSIMRVQDRFYDSKYYNMYQENVTTTAGEVWESEMEVTFK